VVLKAVLGCITLSTTNTYGRLAFQKCNVIERVQRVQKEPCPTIVVGHYVSLADNEAYVFWGLPCPDKTDKPRDAVGPLV
jgi:hypothetical protein